MAAAPRDLIRWQFDLTWSLLELHLDQLEPADVRWEPAPRAWTVHPDADGTWRPDWKVPEPEPVPVPTIAWISWHVGWWWTVTAAHVRDLPVPERTEVAWPGSAAATVDWLRALRTEWIAVLDGLDDTDLNRPAPFPWTDAPGMTLAHTLAWVNAELMKNAAEIGQLRLLRAAGA